MYLLSIYKSFVVTPLGLSSKPLKRHDIATSVLLPIMRCISNVALRRTTMENWATENWTSSYKIYPPIVLNMLWRDKFAC